MAQFFRRENQTFLWETAHSHPQLRPLLQNLSSAQQADLFKSVIRDIHQQVAPSRSISQQELQQLNSSTMQRLHSVLLSINSAQRPIVSHGASVPPHSPTQHPPHSPTQYPPQYPQQQQQHHSPSNMYPHIPPVEIAAGMSQPDFLGQHDFQKRANEYERMSAKPIAPPMQQDDGDARVPADDMERRMAEQMRMREKDAEVFAPPPVVTGSVPVNLNLLKPGAASALGNEPVIPPPLTILEVETKTAKQTHPGESMGAEVDVAIGGAAGSAAGGGTGMWKSSPEISEMTRKVEELSNGMAELKRTTNDIKRILEFLWMKAAVSDEGSGSADKAMSPTEMDPHPGVQMVVEKLVTGAGV
jgi:hypothetical protein